MEFNPLDLLACAAELQQKNDDGPERIIVTRQRRNTAQNNKHAISTGGQKENREIHNNNNNVKPKPKPSVVIVKKIKIDSRDSNPELEKMFDEHNYGNCKKSSNKYEQTDEHNYDFSRDKRNSESQCQSSDTELESSESESIEKKVTLTPVSSQAGDSDRLRVGKSTVNSNTDKSTCPSAGSHCTSNGTPTDCKRENETTKEHKCTQCVKAECCCDSTLTDSIGQHKVNSTHSEDKHTEHMVLKYKGVQSDCSIQSENTDLLKKDVDCLKLDDKTGEFITESGVKVIIKPISSEKVINNNSFENTCDSEQRENDSKQKSINSEKVVHRMVAVKNAKNLKLDSASVKSTSIITSAKMPYVKVIPSKEISSETVLEKKPEALVINISRGHNSSSQLTKSALCDQSTPQNNTNNMCGTDSTGTNNNTGNSVGIIKSIVVNEKNENKKNGEVSAKTKPLVFTMLSPKSKLEMPSCNSSKFHSSTSCDSLKALELSSTICTEESVSSVHLLSPDRRNPDSMGIVESPITQNSSDLSSDTEKDKLTFPFSCVDTISKSSVIDEKGNNFSGITEQNENPIKNSASLTCSTSNRKNSGFSDSALDLEVTGTDSISDKQELMKESRLESGDSQDDSIDNSANDSREDTSGNDVPIFRFDCDHCYAGVPGSANSGEGSSAESQTENETLRSENEEARTPLGSSSELSQDSGYEDVSHSPETAPLSSSVQPTPEELLQVTEKPVVKNLVPVLVSVNTNGSLTLHDTNLTKTLNGPVLALPENLQAVNTGIKVIPATSLQTAAQPLILSPVGKSTSPVLAESTRLVPAKPKVPESILELLRPKVTEQSQTTPVVQASTQQVSPPKFGTFKIGTFASFSNTGMGFENNSPTPVEKKSQVEALLEEKVKRPMPRSRSNSGKSNSGMDTLSTLVQKVQGSLSQSQNQPLDGQTVDHIQHDHDYCTKNLMPSVVSSLLEQRLLSKETGKGKVSHYYGKGKKSEHEHARDLHRLESKTGKRKRNSASLTKVDSMDDFEIDSESDTQSIPEPIKPKSRVEKLLEKPVRPTDPKVKITGSSNFQDQFVYFMNTKKRSRRRESKDAPSPFGDRVFIPPKPGDIIVPHLTDQDIENLKQRSKQFKQSGNISGLNSLRNEFMAAKYANTQYSNLFSSSTAPPAETTTAGAADDEKSIINTILSMENESLASPVQSDPPSYNESMEMYGQGLGNDIMNLFPEQMNLTQEQMDLLYSAVDEVQNSSPGLIGAEKLVSTEPGDSTFGQFPPLPDFNGNSLTEGDKQAASSETVPITTAGNLAVSAITDTSIVTTDAENLKPTTPASDTVSNTTVETLTGTETRPVVKTTTETTTAPVENEATATPMETDETHVEGNLK